jgi:hypothetical protein
MTFSSSSNLMQFRRVFIPVVAMLLITGGPSLAEDAPVGSDVPIELIRLRQQFQSKVDQEMAPWQEKYSKELQKLEDRLINERRLSDALAVKKERESNTGLSSEPAEVASTTISGPPKTAAELEKYLLDTVWMVYAAEDKKSENLIAVYHFYDSVSVVNFSAKPEKLKWSCKSNKDVLISYPTGDITFSVEAMKSIANVDHLGRKYIAILAGRPKKNK